MRKQILAVVLAMLMCLSMAVPAVAKRATEEIKLESVCDAIYDEIGDFHDGYAPAKKDGKWGVINEKGKLVVKAKYDWMADVHEGTVVAATVDKKEQYTLYLVDMKGKAVALKQTLFSGDQSKADGVVLSKNELNTRWGCHDGIVWVDDYAYTSDGANIQLRKENADVFVKNGYTGYKTVGCHGDDGKILMFAITNSGGYLPFVMSASGGIVDFVSLPKYDKKVKSTSLLCYDNGYILVKSKVEEDGQAVVRYGVIDAVSDKNRDYVIPPIYESYQYESYTDSFIYDGTIKLVKDGKIGIVDLKGNVVIPFEYETLVAFMDGMALALKDGQVVYLDKEGYVYSIGSVNGGIAKNIVNATSFCQGIAVVLNKNERYEWYLITKDAKEGVLQPIPGSNQLPIYVFFPNYDAETGYTGGMRLAEEMVNGPIKVKENGKWGLKRLVNLPVSAPETIAPAPETTAPAPETTAPAPETTAPAPETTAPTPETTAPTVTTAPETSLYTPGTPIGDVLYTDIVAYIDDKPIRSYNIAGNTYIVVEDLAAYGFDVRWIAEGSGKLVVGTTRTATPDAYTTTYVPEKNTHPAGSVAMQYLYTNITAWLGDAQVTGYNIGGYTCIGMDDLANTFATNYVWDGVEGALRLYTQP